MRVELIIGAVGFAIWVAIIVAVTVISSPFGTVIPEPLAAAIDLGSGVALAVALFIWRRLAFFAFGASMILMIAVIGGINFGPAAAVRYIAMLATGFAGAGCLAAVLAIILNKIDKSNNAWIQVAVPPILFSGWLALLAWLGSSFVVLFIFGSAILVVCYLNLWRVLRRRRAE
jgi:hypothetical protein